MYQRVLVPLDGSKVGECILSHVKSIVGGCKVGEVILLQIVETPPAWVMEGKNFKESHGAQIKKAEKYLSKIQAQLKLGGVNITAEVLVGGAAETIIAFAKQKKVDLIIMATNVSSTVSRLMIGSVADRVMRYSRLPVLMVRPPAMGC